jgi:methyl-accepting chemotaxis protein
MGFADEARRAAAQGAEREFRKLVDNVNQLVKDMKEVKERLARLENQSGQTQAGAEPPRQSGSDAQ